MWSLALAAIFNTPSQLGRTPSANPSVSQYYLPSMHFSALLNYEEEVIENVSYHSLLTRSISIILAEGVQ